MKISKLMVVGAGQMGIGIAQVAATAGLTVVLHDTSKEWAERGFSCIRKLLKKNVQNNKISEDEMVRILSHIVLSDDLRDAENMDAVIEAVVEKREVKKNIFQTLDRICRPCVVLASNTSSIPITEIAAWTGRPDRVIGMHFMNPAPVMRLVEVIRGLATTDETFRIVESLAVKMGKVPVEVNDAPGFIANRVLIPMINEAVFCVHEGVGTVEAVDRVFKLGMNHPMGPLQLADFIGLDTCLYIMETLHEGLGDSKYRPSPLLRKYVAAGWLGKKSGRGFYDYSSNP